MSYDTNLNKSLKRKYQNLVSLLGHRSIFFPAYRPTGHCPNAHMASPPLDGSNATLTISLKINVILYTKHTFDRIWHSVFRLDDPWSPYLEKDVDCLETVQKRATKMVHGLKDLKYAGRLKRLGLYSLQRRRLRRQKVILRRTCPILLI